MPRGRPRKLTDKMTVSFVITEDLHSALETWCAERGVSLSEGVRTALYQMLDVPEPPPVGKPAKAEAMTREQRIAVAKFYFALAIQRDLEGRPVSGPTLEHLQFAIRTLWHSTDELPEALCIPLGLSGWSTYGRGVQKYRRMVGERAIFKPTT